jgi:hypothetical protein
MDIDDYMCWWKIRCMAGDELSISITVNKSGDYALVLLDPDNVQAESDTGDPTSSLSISHTCLLSGDYYIYFSISNMTSYRSLSLTVSGATSMGIPGFQMIFMISGLLISIGFTLIFLRNRWKN